MNVSGVQHVQNIMVRPGSRMLVKGRCVGTRGQNSDASAIRTVFGDRHSRTKVLHRYQLG